MTNFWLAGRPETDVNQEMPALLAPLLEFFESFCHFREALIYAGEDGA
jgi:hypothetical protein